MRQGYFVILDVGKTLAKLSLWSGDGQLIERRTRENTHCFSDNYPCLDVAGVAAWLTDTLGCFGRIGPIEAIVPVAHGAAAAVIDEGELSLAPLNYETEPPKEIHESYQAMRDPFALTGSPLLPAALNLGLQLHWLETLAPEKMRRGRIVTWPQFWAWYLCGIATTEVTSLGCHTDLWMPANGHPSPMATTRGWAARFAPLHRAHAVLGPVKQDIRARCALPDECDVLCGLHDSNAALLASRRYAEVAGSACTVVSTGTWFVAMRTGAEHAAVANLQEGRDCLVNVDAFGVPVPSARFMGGREVELIEQADDAQIDPAAHAGTLLAMARELVTDGVMALPAFQGGVGPYPRNVGGWNRRPDDQMRRRAGAGLYLALMANAALDLLGSNEPLVIEGRFAGDAVFTRTLAALRPDCRVYPAPLQDNVPLGALQLISPRPPHGALTAAVPPDFDITPYAAQWRLQAERTRKNARIQQ